LRAGIRATSLPHVVVVRLDDTRRGPHESPAAGRIVWARRFMPASARLAARLAEDGTVRGVRIGVSMVLEPKTAVLALMLRDAGAEVSVFSHPDETDDDVADALREAGLRVHARAAAEPDEHRALALAFLEERPTVLVDDGSHVIRLAHEAAPHLLDGMIGAAEETTSGLRPLRAMAAEGLLRIPVVAVNDARSKTLFDNRYGTGQSCLFTILGLTGLDLFGAAVVVAGYGPVGEGVARHARAFGARVVVAEPDPVRALAATYDGFRVSRPTWWCPRPGCATRSASTSSWRARRRPSSPSPVACRRRSPWTMPSRPVRPARSSAGSASGSCSPAARASSSSTTEAAST